jgi:hypothetical protein
MTAHGRLGMLVLVVTLGACASVAPYQRERLAHHSLLEEDYVGLAEQHVRSVQEGAIGGSQSAADGCGCN